MSKKLLKHIQSRVRIKRDVTYEVVWLDDFKDETQVGECRPNHPQLVIKKNQSPTQTFLTYIHEIIHAIDLENDVGLTEAQVLKLEKAVLQFMKLNKIVD